MNDLQTVHENAGDDRRAATLQRDAPPRQPEARRDGAPIAILRLEGALALVVASLAYAKLGGGVWLFAALFLVPDVAMLFYLVDARRGAYAYNLAHTYLSPAVVCALALFFHGPVALLAGLVWVAHIGFDRLAGYGLKHVTGFKHTHLDFPA